MFRFERILVAHDLGAGSDRALERAQQLAAQWQVPLLAVHAMPRSPEPPGPAIERIRRELGGDLADARIHVHEGEPVDVILQVANRERCDLVVLGDADEPSGRASRGIIEALVDRSPVSTLVVRRRARVPYRRVLVGTDLTPESRHGLEAAAALFPLADFTVLHALDIPYESLWLSPSRSADLLRMEQDTIEAFAAAADIEPELRKRMRLAVEHAHPELALRERALSGDDELAVIGAFRRGIAARILAGGTTRRIVRTMPADVLVVRAAAAAE